MTSYTLQTKDYKHFKLIPQKEDFVEPILFEGASTANGCFHGDTVSYTPTEGCQLIERCEHPLLAGILDLRGKTKYGFTTRGVPMYLFSPHRSEYPSFVVGCADRDLTKNKLVLVKISDEEQASKSGRSLPRGTLHEVLGNCGDPSKERLALLWAYTPFMMPKTLYESEGNRSSKRREFELRPKTPPNTFHIDPPECHDVDDVLSIEKVGDGNHRIWITISDVAEWIEPGTAMDSFAKRAGFTTYENGIQVRPMLPPGYSENLCSLLPGKEGLGISLVFDWDGSSISNVLFLKTTVNVKRTYTYEQANAEQSEEFNVLRRITEFLTGTKEPDAHTIIETLMILYNREVASILRVFGVGILRKHESHELSKWEKFEALAPECTPLAYKVAKYCSADVSDVYHAGLGLSAYCTVTSPIRRYADLVNQRILKSFLGFNKQEIVHPDLDLDALNTRQKDIKKYERDTFFLTNMFANEGRILKGVVLNWKDVQGEGQITFHVYIPEWKRILKWRTGGKIVGDRVLAYLWHRKVAHQTYVEEMQALKFEIYWNPQERYWKDKLVLRLA
jgi:exoribonuclease R